MISTSDRKRIGREVIRVPSAVGFSPLSLSPLMWLDASDTSSINHTAGAVNQWSDKSGNGYHVTASSTARPTTASVTRNGLNTVDFNGTTNVMLTSTVFTDATQTWYFAGRCTSATSFSAPMFAGPVAAAGATLGPYLNGGVQAYTYQGGVHLRTLPTRSTSDIIHWTAVFAGASASGLNAIKVNGTDYSQSGAHAAGAPAPTDKIAIGGLTRTSSPYLWVGQIYECLFYSGVHSPATRATVQSYLTTKWGTS